MRQFSERLAVDLYVNSERRGAERTPRHELAELAKEWNIPLDEWQLSGRSLLNRDAEGNYKFAHRSIMEFLFVERLFQNESAYYGKDLTDLMKAFLWEKIPQHVAEKKPFADGVKALVWDLISRQIAAKKTLADEIKPLVWDLIQQQVIAQKPLPFNLAELDLGTYRPPIRSLPLSNLQTDYAGFVLRKHDFFDSS